MALPNTPWLAFYGAVPAHLTYPQIDVWQQVSHWADMSPRATALSFFNKRTSYYALRQQVQQAMQALVASGVSSGDRVAICLPNCPQAVILFYAVGAIGAIPCLMHPLSAPKELVYNIKQVHSRHLILLDQIYPAFKPFLAQLNLDLLVVTGVQDAMPRVLQLGYALTQKKPAIARGVCTWKTFLKRTTQTPLPPKPLAEQVAVLLYSGGTTGTSKGVCLTHNNLNALAAQIVATNPMFSPGDAMLAVMPIFHGFGLGVGIHAMLAKGGSCLLVPRFTAKSFARLLRKKNCRFVAGVPSLYAAVLHQPVLKRANLSHLKGVFCGGDALSNELKQKMDAFLQARGAKIQVREGYGATECVSASCLTPVDTAKPGSIGVPFPDTYFQIVKPGSLEPLPYGTEGEICICGPTVMAGYFQDPKETAKALERDAEGNVWLHTGDLGVMDADGFVSFRQRIKRMIVTNGYNVYPSQIEHALMESGLVAECCVVGAPDPLRMQIVTAFVVPCRDDLPEEMLIQQLKSHLSESIARYALPRIYYLRAALPHTIIGKVDYRKLEEELKNPPVGR